MAAIQVFVQPPPPPRAQLGGPLHPPIVVVLSGPRGTHQGSLFATAHIDLDGNGDEPLPGALSGTKTANGCVGEFRRRAEKQVWLFSWPDLAFFMTGSFSLRIRVYEADNRGATLVRGVRTREFVVTEEPVVRTGRMSKFGMFFLVCCDGRTECYVYVI